MRGGYFVLHQVTTHEEKKINTPPWVEQFHCTDVQDFSIESVTQALQFWNPEKVERGSLNVEVHNKNPLLAIREGSRGFMKIVEAKAGS